VIPPKQLAIALSFMLLLSAPLFGSGGSGTESISPILAALVIILVVGKGGSEFSERLGLPAVLGELLGGVILGNIILINPQWNFFEPLRVTPVEAHWAVVVDGLAQLGVIILLFEVGLESSVQGMMKVGGSSLLVAIIGVIAPFILGFGVSWFFIKELPAGLIGIVPAGFSLNYIHLFIGAVLCATSVGITARVFKDLGKLNTKVAQIILWAAVIDDVLGLIILAAVSGVVVSAETGKTLTTGAVFRIIGTAILFLGGSLGLGTFLVPRILKQLAKLRTSGIMLLSALLFAFFMSYLANAAGLAAVVGAFAAGLLLENVHFRGFEKEEISIEQLLRPVATFLVPIYFVSMGIQMRLETFGNLSVLGVAAGLTVAAIAGKQVCGFGVLERGLDRQSVGVGMIPRGEVGLIFAGIGKQLRVVDDATFSAIVIMVIVTTLITPAALKWSLARGETRISRQSL
jgi:Kef-type K+ transport system membrane component KefB